MSRELRKQRHMLVSLGKGVILFGAWNVLKAVLTLILIPESFLGEEDLQMITGEHLWPFFVLLISIILCAMLAFRLFIGLGAIRRGQGIRKGSGFIVGAGVLALFSILGILAELQVILTDWSSLASPSLLVSILVDLTSLILETDLILTALRERRLSKTEAGRG